MPDKGLQTQSFKQTIAYLALLQGVVENLQTFHLSKQEQNIHFDIFLECFRGTKYILYISSGFLLLKVMKGKREEQPV